MNLLQYEPAFGDEEADAVNVYMRSGRWMTESVETEKFEKAIGAVLEVPHVSAVNNGTISLSIALLAAGIRPGDRVIVPDITMIATANAARMLFADPVFVDLDPTNLCLDLNAAKQAIIDDPKIKAVMYVSLNGRSASASELWEFNQFCSGRGVMLIEDAAQSFGSRTSEDAAIGTIAPVGSFSFSPHKIISTGQGGCLVTSDKALGEKMERLKDFGRLTGGADVHDHFGINSKFTDIQAVIGLEQLKKLDRRIEMKKDLYAAYTMHLANVEGVSFLKTDLNHTVPWFVDVYVQRRAELIAHLKSKGIQSRPLYPALHTQAIYPEQNNRHDLAAAKAVSDMGLWLPSSFKLTSEDVEFVCNEIKAFYAV